MYYGLSGLSFITAEEDSQIKIFGPSIKWLLCLCSGLPVISLVFVSFHNLAPKVSLSQRSWPVLTRFTFDYENYILNTHCLHTMPCLHTIRSYLKVAAQLRPIHIFSL